MVYYWHGWPFELVLTSTPGPKYCAECGAVNPPEARMCISCGKMLNP